MAAPITLLDLDVATSSQNEKLIDIIMTMATEKAEKFHAKVHRHRTVPRERSKRDNPSVIYLQVVGTGANGTPRALFVFTTHQRYLFNCGEGTQRIANEHKMRLSRLENIFITHKNWGNVGGLPGVTLTIQDIGVKYITLHGPPGIENLYQMTRDFIMLKRIKIGKHEYFNEPFEDNALRIESVPIFSTQDGMDEKKVTEENGEFINCYSNGGSSDGSSCSSSPTSKSHHTHGRKRQKMSPSPPVSTDKRDMSLAFICKARATAGHLSLQKCNEFNVPVGPLLGKLKNGEDVTLEDGTVVLSKDVSSPEEPGPIFIVVECPTINFLDSLLSAPQFERHQATAESRSDYAEVVVHFTPYEVINHPKYKEWIRRFSPETQHILLNDSCPGIANISAFRIQQKLNLIHPEVFPLLNSENQTKPIDILDEDGNVTLGEPLLQYHLRPKTRFDRSGIISIQSDEYLQGVQETVGLAEAFADLKKSIARYQNVSSGSDGDYPMVTFLGTGSSIPSKVRNVSSILVHLSAEKCMLMDCGEGTFGQMLRFYGWEETTAILKKLSIIFISHLHADHHTGLLKILHERRTAFGLSGFDDVPQLHLLAPHQIRLWLNQYNNEFSRIVDQYILIPNKSIQYGVQDVKDDWYFIRQDLLKNIDMMELSSVEVEHCLNAYGIILKHKDGWKLVYSGDTMPCVKLIEAGRPCDLLIHEATMEDELLQDAKMKTHSTTSQAIEVGRKMDARFTMLTHFSQRYAKVPLFTEEFHSGVGVAFDNMKVSLKNLCLTPLFIPILKVMFTEDYDMMQDRGLRRKRQQERLAEAAEAKQANLDLSKEETKIAS